MNRGIVATFALALTVAVASIAGAHHPPKMERCATFSFSGQIERIVWQRPHVELFIKTAEELTLQEPSGETGTYGREPYHRVDRHAFVPEYVFDTVERDPGEPRPDTAKALSEILEAELDDRGQLSLLSELESGRAAPKLQALLRGLRSQGLESSTPKD